MAGEKQAFLQKHEEPEPPADEGKAAKKQLEATSAPTPPPPPPVEEVAPKEMTPVEDLSAVSRLTNQGKTKGANN